MEQSQPTEAPAVPPTPEKPKTPMKTWMIIAVVAVVAVVLIAAVVLGTGMLNSNDDGDDGNDGGNGATTWEQKAGDYMEWTASGGGFSMTMRIEVKAVTADNLTINTTISSSFGSSSMEQTVDRNGTMGSSYDLTDLPNGVTYTDKGTQSISTKWGSISAHHYTVVDEETPGLTITTDFWVKDGILLKSVQVATGITTTMTLTATNITMITG
jgi:hypothetical protein